MSGHASPDSGEPSASSSRRSSSAARSADIGAALAGSRLSHRWPINAIRSSAESASTENGREAMVETMRQDQYRRSGGCLARALEDGEREPGLKESIRAPTASWGNRSSASTTVREGVLLRTGAGNRSGQLAFRGPRIQDR